MELDLKKIKDMHDKAYIHNQKTREEAANDLLFYWITHWDGDNLGSSTLAYKGQFDVLRKAGRQILADLRANPVQVDFKPKDESRDDDADFLDGLYRADDRVNSTLEAYDRSGQEAVVCGFGGYVLYTEYASNRSGDSHQVIRRKPINEANNTVFIDPNAVLMDKSDMDYISIITPYSKDGYKALVKELGVDDENPSNFATPKTDYRFPWTSEDRHFVSEFYHRYKTKDTVLTLEDPFGDQKQYLASDLKDEMSSLIDAGYSITEEKDIERYEVKKYIASGDKILHSCVIAGEHIPFVPRYGERAFVNGAEHYEGITRLAKDPQRLRNFQLSYLAEIYSRSPRPKPIFFPSQIGQYASMYQDNGAENNLPYYLLEEKDANGNALPPNPVGMMPEQKVPDALMTGIALSREAIEDVANAGLPKDIADTDLSGKAIQSLGTRLDKQSFIFQQNGKFSKRRDAEIYASMASQVYAAPRKVTLSMPDGQTKKADVMESTIDDEGNYKVVNDLTNQEFDVYAEIGTEYQTQKEQDIEGLENMISSMLPEDPARNLLMLKRLELMSGDYFKEVREYATKQLVIQGIREPQTPEEEQYLAEAQQQQQPDANMVLAQAEQLKGQAAVAREQREAAKDQANIQLGAEKLQVDKFKAQTDRMGLQVDAEKVGAEIDYKEVQRLGQQIDNAQKLTFPSLRTSVNSSRP